MALSLGFGNLKAMAVPLCPGRDTSERPSKHPSITSCAPTFSVSYRSSAIWARWWPSSLPAPLLDFLT